MAVAALDQAEDALRHPGLFDGGEDGFGHDLAGAGMGGVALDHDRAARGQCGGGVAARGREGQREKFDAPKTATGPIGRWIMRRSGRGSGWRSGRAASWRRSR